MCVIIRTRCYCLKSVRIRCYSGPYFPVFGLNTDQNNSKYGHFLRNVCTVFYPINGHSKTRTPLISGQFFFHRPNSGQSLIKSFLKGGQVISGHSKIFRNQNRKNDKIERFSKYLFQAFRNFAFKLFFYSFNLLNQPSYKSFLAIKTIDNQDFKTVAPSTV